MLVLCGLNSVCCITGREDQLKWDWDPPESTFKASQKSPSATEEKLYFAPFITSCQIWQKISLPPKQWYFMLYFLCINWAGCPPWCAFKDSKESANPTWIVPSQLSTQCVTRYHRNIHKNIFRHNTPWSMTLKAFLSASGEFWMMRVTDVAGRVSWRCLGCCYLSPFFLLPPFSTGTSLCCLITSSTNAHSSEREAGGDMEKQRKIFWYLEK